MASKMHKFTGPIRWAQVFEDNRDMEGFEGAAADFGGQYSIQMKLDSDQWDKLKDTGSMKKGMQKDPDWVKFTRKHEGPFAAASGPPRVVTKDNRRWDYVDDGPIGNDSIAEVTVVIYDTKRRGIVGTRLEKVKILEHNEYVPEGEEEEDQVDPNEGRDADDEIPF